MIEPRFLRQRGNINPFHFITIGKNRETRNGDALYGGFNGTARITGTNVLISLSGVNIDLKASGTGRYVLRGRGIFTATNSLNHTWVGAERELK
jgi:hypothetical protein